MTISVIRTSARVRFYKHAAQHSMIETTIDAGPAAEIRVNAKDWVLLAAMTFRRGVLFSGDFWRAPYPLRFRRVPLSAAWHATVNGEQQPIKSSADGMNLVVELPPGSSIIRLEFRSRTLPYALTIASLAALFAAGIAGSAGLKRAARQLLALV